MYCTYLENKEEENKGGMLLEFSLGYKKKKKIYTWLERRGCAFIVVNPS